MIDGWCQIAQIINASQCFRGISLGCLDHPFMVIACCTQRGRYVCDWHKPMLDCASNAKQKTCVTVLGSVFRYILIKQHILLSPALVSILGLVTMKHSQLILVHLDPCRMNCEVCLYVLKCSAEGSPRLAGHWHKKESSLCSATPDYIRRTLPISRRQNWCCAQ